MQALRLLAYWLLIWLAVRRLHAAARALRRAHRVAGGMRPVMMPVEDETMHDMLVVQAAIEEGATLH